MRIGFIEPHLRCFGGIRRVLEFGNRLVARGHEVTYYLPDDEAPTCDWMPCAGQIRPVSAGATAPLDVVVFNHEPHWFLLDTFVQTRRRVFYALHDGGLYGKEGSWEAARLPVDLQLANSSWTAERIAAATGSRPIVQLGGANRDQFHPRDVPHRYELLTSGMEKWWKGADTVRAAAALAGARLEEYAGKGLTQDELGVEYASARLFAVGSLFEGFCQPGLEAMASGVPLVTTDNGGCREYALADQTALVVPPDDPAAMAAAIALLRADPDLAARLRAAGLDLVAESFDWEQRTDELAERLDGVVAAPSGAPRPCRPARDTPADPVLSVVVLAWDNLLLTQRFVESVRRHTDVPYELIVVDNGSAPEAARYARLAADVAVCNDTNLGFSRGMNQGLAEARGRYVAFCNNDTTVPPGWAARLLETARRHPEAGIVVPALTKANNPRTVRDRAADNVEVIDPFSAPPPAVLFLMYSDLTRELGGWSERYEIASGEDVDLAFTVWVNDLDIVFDERVLVQHVSKGSAQRLDDWAALWARNRERFLDAWEGDVDPPLLACCEPARFRRNRAIARATAGWMRQYFRQRDRTTASSADVAGAAGRRRRAAEEWAIAWAATAPVADPTELELVRTADGRVTLIDRGSRRAVTSALVAEAVARITGPPQSVEQASIDCCPEGPPVELLEPPDELPYLHLGGWRFPVRGLPLPHAVAEDAAAGAPVGAIVDLGSREGRAGAGTPPELTPPPGTDGRLGEMTGLARTPDGTVFVLEAGARREVTSALVARALEQAYGPARPVETAALEFLPVGRPVEVVDVGRGAAVLVGGVRHPVRGLPPRVRGDGVAFRAAPEGAAIDVSDLRWLGGAARRADAASAWFDALQPVVPRVPTTASPASTLSASGALPTFLIIGAQKCATRWLRHNLALHPDAFVLADEAEFFDDERRFRGLGLDWYRGLFGAGADARVRGESTPGYMMWRSDPARVADRVAAALPDVHLIALVRDPVDRAQSALLHHVTRGRMPWGSDLAATVAETSPEVDPLGLVTGGWYGSSLEPFADRFGDRLLVLVTEEVANDPVTAYRDVLLHLGLASFTPPELGRVRASNREHRGAVRPLTEGDRAELWPYFAAEVDRLQQLLGRELDWPRPAIVTEPGDR